MCIVERHGHGAALKAAAARLPGDARCATGGWVRGWTAVARGRQEPKDRDEHNHPAGHIDCSSADGGLPCFPAGKLKARRS